MKASEKQIEKIKLSEGFKPKMYKDAVGKPTIGYGTLIDTEAEHYLLTAVITKEEADKLLRKDVEKMIDIIAPKIKVALSQNQIDAIISFVYNLGTGNFLSSTLLKKINLNPYDPNIQNEFLRWNKAGKKVLAGLTKRRKEESELYFKA